MAENGGKLRVAMLLPGLGRVQRGAETAFLEVGQQLARFDDIHVEMFGSGERGPAGVPWHSTPARPREHFERWPCVPGFRDETAYEEFSFVWNLRRLKVYNAARFDVAMTCSYPWLTWHVQRAGKKHNTAHVFVTQNGDWCCHAGRREYRYFSCDGLVCINPEYYERNRSRWNAMLIPNGVDPAVFRPADPTAPDPPIDPRLPADRPIVLMASAMIPSKRVADGVRAVAHVPDAFFAVAGDGPERQSIARLAEELLPGRHALLGSLPREQLPALYRRASVFLHMSQEEPFGIVYLEAAATGLPIVTHDGAIPHWILGDTALFADSSDHAAIGAHIRHALQPEVRSALGAAARQRIQEGWSWQALAGKYREFLFQVTRQRPRG